MKFEEEFETVELLVASNHPTKMVDAFSLSLIKAERQVRKLFTYLVFQNTNLSSANVNELRNVLADFRRVYFEGFVAGINVLSNKTLADLYGEHYEEDMQRLDTAICYRNKIFHGQLTTEKLSSEDLGAVIENIKRWCQRLSEAAHGEYGYCGFGRNSFQKSSLDLSEKISTPINNPDEYRAFITEHMRR
ncbi:hypothetical protein V8073_004689 [Vibrio parahaemolyticus]|nr:hypothetical protein [Vibrio vulnificus]HCE2205614.1 hypothetical protein [Vibrio parahaemolyticus]HCG5516699.1 hypothetical protein [Vibrio parahaemolyticus]